MYNQIDFKFLQKGETNWLPSGFDFSPQLALNNTPNGFSEAYVKNMERIGSMTEVYIIWNIKGYVHHSMITCLSNF
jgi:hypothetical protein